MDKTQLIHTRKARYMAQLLDDFEAKAAPLLPAEIADEFKGVVRQKMTALAVDAAEIADLEESQNELIAEMRLWMERHRPQPIATRS